MNILIDIGHPAHVHFFKNMIWSMQNTGTHNIKITARDKEVTLKLLHIYRFNCDVVGIHKKYLLHKALDIFNRDYSLYKIAKDFKPDILIGASGNFYVSHVAWLLRKPSVVFDDTEHSIFEIALNIPFASKIVTPVWYKKKLGKKQIKYNGFKELAYLHPKYFKPSPELLKDLNIKEGEKLIIVRFVSWNASHDFRYNGLDNLSKLTIIEELSKHGKILINSESELPINLRKYSVNISPEKMHDLLYYATLYIGEGATMATEAAILGTPSIYISPLSSSMGNFDVLSRYELIYLSKDINQTITKAVELLQNKDIKNVWRERRDKLLKDKIDVTEFMIEFIEKFQPDF